MPVSRALRRLFQVRTLEEEQSRMLLASSQAELHALELAFSAARARGHRGRILLIASVGAPEAMDRAAAHVEIQTGAHHALLLAPRIEEAQAAVSRARQAFLEVRLERRQVETLIEEAEAQLALALSRTDQQVLDETFGSHKHRQKLAAQRSQRILALNRQTLIDLELEIPSTPVAPPDSGKLPKL